MKARTLKKWDARWARNRRIGERRRRGVCERWIQEARAILSNEERYAVR